MDTPVVGIGGVAETKLAADVIEATRLAVDVAGAAVLAVEVVGAIVLAVEVVRATILAFEVVGATWPSAIGVGIAVTATVDATAADLPLARDAARALASAACLALSSARSASL